MIKRINPTYLLWGSLLVFLALTAPVWVNYLNIKFSLNNVALLMLPFIIRINNKSAYSSRFIWLSLISAAAFYFLGLVFFLFLSIGLGVFGLIEMFKGKISLLAVIALFLVTPLVKYFFDVFGFPIRLMLSNWATHLIGWFTESSVQEGNSIIINGEKFSVDAACMGLKMVITSLLFALFVIVFKERKTQKSYSNKQLLVFGLLSIGLIILSNFLRIVLLIVFKSAPETFSHETIGILSLVLVVFFPLMYASNKVVPSKSNEEEQPRKKPRWLISFLIIPLILCFGFKPQNDIPFDKKIAEYPLKGYQSEVLQNNVVKFTNSWAKVFVKPISSFANVTHEPFLCWRGTGFSINNEKLQRVYNKPVCTANLIRGNEQLFTAWFYTNGETYTTSQFKWRKEWVSLEKKFYLVNVSAISKTLLDEELKKVFDSNIFIAL
jgi:exosortase N